MGKLVTIGIPVYKRLQYLPRLLSIIESQDYPDLELIVSDNGQNGTKVHDLVKAHYSRRFRVRQNPKTVPMAVHWNQIVNEAAGEYFINIADDDEVSSNYASELVQAMERYPNAAVAISAQEIIDPHGAVLRRQTQSLPEGLPYAEFIAKAWQTYEFGFENFSSLLARTAEIKACGGFLDFCRGNFMDNALLIQLCLGRAVAFSSGSLFRNRYDMASEGWSVSLAELATATKEFLRFLKSDPTLLNFAKEHPTEWAKCREILETMAWQTYFERWRTIYRGRMSRLAWTRGAFALPFIPQYYMRVGVVMKNRLRSGVAAPVKNMLGWHSPANVASGPKQVTGAGVAGRSSNDAARV